MPRTIAIGDIHGCARALKTLFDLIALKPDDTLVLLGDYVSVPTVPNTWRVMGLDCAVPLTV